MIKYRKEAKGIVTLILDMKNSEQNIINHEIGRAFIPVLNHLKKDKAADDLKGVIITSAKDTFLTGGDLDYLTNEHSAKEIFNYVERQKLFFRELETLGVPLVAAINGAALGAGFELALACHYRIALNNKHTVTGLPEATLGLIPSGGGIIRLMWMLGIEKTFRILSEGRKIKPAEALKIGLINDLAEDPKELISKAKKWIWENPDSKQVWDMDKARIPGGNAKSPKIAQLLAGATAMLVKKTRNNYPAPQAILNTLAEASQVDFETANRIESRYFTQILQDKTSHNMTKAFWYDLKAINAGQSRPKGFGKFRPRKIGIIGAGMMGSGIAYVTALSGLDVVLKDVSSHVAEKGKEYSAKLLDKQIAKGRMQEARKKEILDRIQTTENAKDFEQCDLVIEAVFENRNLKAMVTKEAEKFLEKETIFASNTSTLPISGLAEESIRPANFVGLHFFSPVDKMKLVEIIVGEKTSQETLARAFDYVKQIRKIPIVVNDSRGFYTSRVFGTFIKEGLALLDEGFPPIAIENAALNAGMPVGPLALSDEVSISLIMDIEEQTIKDLGENYTQQPGVPVMQKMVKELDRKGKAKGAGFYEYPANEKKFLWPELNKHFPVKEQFPNINLMQNRIMFVQAIETMRCLEEGVISNDADANIGSIFGWGFAPFKGGTVQFIHDYGVENFILKAKELEQAYGERFKVPENLLQLKTT